MEHLIELLNEYEKNRDYYTENGYIMYRDDEWVDVDDKRTDLEIISSSYWFIQWLVENEKIDFDSDIEFYFLQREQHTKVESLLMLLSIQEKPIEFLVSILK